MYMTSLNLFVIHTEALDVRKPLIAATLKCFQETFDKVTTTFITKPDASDINHGDIEKRIKYDNTGDKDFDAMMAPLALEEISNTLKHEEAWRRISSLPDDDLYAVIEDDAVFLETGQAHLRALQACIKEGAWDVLFLGLTKPGAPPDAPQALQSVSETFKVVPNKEAYLVTPAGAKLLLEGVATIRFSTRQYLSWMNFTSLRAAYPTWRVTADSSKLGLMPSSIHTNNMLVLNHEYMRMWQLFSKPELLPEDMTEVEAMYKAVEHLKSPDVIHLYGVLLFRSGKHEAARDTMQAAIAEMRRKKGLLNARSDMLNNAISLYQHLQNDVETTAAAASRYAK